MKYDIKDYEAVKGDCIDDCCFQENRGCSVRNQQEFECVGELVSEMGGKVWKKKEVTPK